MLAAATTAAAAPDILAGPPPAPVYSYPTGDWKTGDFFTDSFDGTATSQWVRFRLPWRSTKWWLAWRFGSGFSGVYQFTVYRSSNLGEDGSTLEQTGQWTGNPNGSFGAWAGTEVSSVWVYIQATPVTPFVAESTDLAYADVQLTQTARVDGRSDVTAGHVVRHTNWARVFGYTDVVVRGPIHGLPQQVTCWSICAVNPVRPPPVGTPGQVHGSCAVQATAVITGPSVVGTPERVAGSTTITVRIGRVLVGVPDDAAGSTAVDVAPGGAVHGGPARVEGSTTVVVQLTAELTDNPPIQLSFDTHAELRLMLPDDDEETGDLDLERLGGPLFVAGHSARRTMPIVSFDVPTPIVMAGKPYVPRWHAYSTASGTATQGSHHIRATDPAPAWDPVAGGWSANPPDGPAWSGRWVVDDLPDPPDGGYYWLGDPTWADGTGNYKGGRTRWAAHASTPHAPDWRSFFPYKPSVRAYDSYLPDGGVVHHPKGVHFNSEFVEHMWADFGGPRRQPFSWVIAGMIAGYPSTHYRHYLLDAGRNPDKVHFPRLSVNDVYQPHTIHDDLDYRSLIAYSRNGQLLCTRHDLHGPHHVHVRADPHRGRPKMFFGVFNGANSYVGAFGPNSKRIAKGRVDNGPAQHHRFYVLGRAQGAIDQDQASHALIFEIRYWRHALTRDQLESQYHQLASTYHFHRYRRV